MDDARVTGGISDDEKSAESSSAYRPQMQWLHHRSVLSEIRNGFKNDRTYKSRHPQEIVRTTSKYSNDLLSTIDIT